MVAWILLQLVNNVAPILGSPVWVARACLSASSRSRISHRDLLRLDAGVPALRDGIEGPDHGSGLDADGRADRRHRARLLSTARAHAGDVTAQKQTGVDAAGAAAASPKGAISIVVLPFTNMSGDATQAFFPDGMTEEITSALAKVPDLRVVARTSAYQFRGQNRDIRSIGQQLHATHFIEGSVRKAGDRVRITVQLIKAGDGTHSWAEVPAFRNPDCPQSGRRIFYQDTILGFRRRHCPAVPPRHAAMLPLRTRAS